MALPPSCEPTAVIKRFIRGGLVASTFFTVALAFCVATSAWATGRPSAVLTALLLGAILPLTGTFIPYCRGGQRTDTLLLRKLSKPGSERDFVVSHFLLTSQAVAGVRSRDLDEASIEKLGETAEGEANRVTAHLYAYYFAQDRGDLDQASEHLEKANEIVISNKNLGRLADGVYLEMAFQAAFVDQDAAKARELLDRVKSKADILEYSRLKAVASIEVLERSANALIAIDEAETALRRVGRRLGCDMDQGLELIARLRQALSLAPSLVTRPQSLTE